MVDAHVVNRGSLTLPCVDDPLDIRNHLTLAVVVSFLDEESYLPVLLASIEQQSLPPDRLLLVDDGSRDSSLTIAQAFANRHPWAVALHRPVRPASADRLAHAAELCAFNWGVERLADPWDIVAKLDADLELPRELFAAVRDRFATDPKLGMTGTYLYVRTLSGRLRLDRSPPGHVRGAVRFYRRRCFEEIAPIPPILGWDTIDELRARLYGWSTESFFLASGKTVHLRPKGACDGRLRAYRREGRCAWAYGAHPLWILLSVVNRGRDRPYLLAWMNYVFGWTAASLSRHPRAEAAVRSRAKLEQLLAIRRRLTPRPTV
jgi:glycosyltransferase involved in cell wall biosynthesis